VVRERSEEIFFFGKVREMKNWCHQMKDLQAKMYQIRFSLGLQPDPTGGAYSSPRSA